MSDYHLLLSSLMNLVTGPLRDLDARIGIPVITALLLGLIGSTSPCQLTTNVTALAYVSRDAKTPRRVLGSAALYLLGKVAVYSLLGSLVAVVGLEVSRLAVPVAALVRKAMGPLLILGGLFMLGVPGLSLSVGRGVSARLEDAAGRTILPGPLLLGAAFALAFCPTLFWLFFGLLMPMSLSSPGGPAFPAVFALGTALPLLVFTGLLAAGVRNLSRYLRQMKRVAAYARPVVGMIFVLGGINEVILYWVAR